jgi:uncharacterized spore protein YtfJ
VNIDDMVKGTQDAASVRRVYGDPIERDGTTVIPAAAIRGGGGGGGGSGSNGGGGFGVTARPVGAYVIRDGLVRWEPALDVSRIAFMGQLVAIVMLLALRSLWKARYRARR